MIGIAKKCWKVGCIRAGAVKTVITAPMYIKTTMTRVANYALVLEDGICKECFAVLGIQGYMSYEDWQRRDYEAARRGFTINWSKAQIHAVSLDFRGVIDGKFHQDDLEADGVQVPGLIVAGPSGIQ